MAIRRKIYFKRIFRTGYIPNSIDYRDFSDSFVNKNTNKAQFTSGIISSANNVRCAILSAQAGNGAEAVKCVDLQTNTINTGRVRASVMSLSVNASVQPTSSNNFILPAAVNVLVTALTSALTTVRAVMRIGEERIVFNRGNFSYAVAPDINSDITIDSLATNASFIVSSGTKYGFVMITSAKILSRNYN